MGNTGRDEPVADGRATAQEPGGAGHGRHAGPHALFKTGSLPFAHRAEDVEHDVVGFGGEVDLTADLGHPQADAVVLHGGGDSLVLHRVAEGPLWFADDDPVPGPVRVGHRAKQPACLGSTVPRQRPGHVGVVDGLHDLCAAGYEAGAE
jgi:hypothetical protein